MKVRTVIVAFCLLSLASPLWINAQDLVLDPDDIAVENHGDTGLHLFIRKKPDIGSVMLTESTRDPQGVEDTLAYRAQEWNPVNGDERRVSGGDVSWSLLDSSPERHPLLEEAFHIYIPPVIVYGGEEGRRGAVAVAEGAYINIRTFALPYADYDGPFEDNPFTLNYFSYSEPDPVPPEPLPILPEPFPPLAEGPPLGTPDGDFADTAPDAADTEGTAEGTGKKAFVFTPQVEARFGLRVFFPGPRGVLRTSLPLKNTYNPVGIIALTQPVSETQRVILEIERSSFSLNRIIARGVWDIGIVGIEAGPYLGFLNTETWDISPGLSVALHLRPPGWDLSGFFRLDAPLGRDPSNSGDYTQTYVSAALNYAFPWATFTLGMTERDSDVVDNDDVLRLGRWVRFYLASAFSPFERWAFRVDLGLEQLQWDYKQPLITLKYDGEITLYAALEASYTFPSGFLTLIAALEGPVYPFVYPVIFEDLSHPAAALFGRATLGFRLTPQK